jgi:hypothetical protein
MTALGPVYFDRDGTLPDPRIGITRSIQYALTKQPTSSAARSSRHGPPPH